MADPLSMDRTLDRDRTNYSGASLTIGQRGSDRPALKYLNRYVIPHITECWHEVGLELLEPERENEAQLNIIKNEPGLSSKERADKMLSFWLNKSPAASWNDLIRTLRVPSIGLHTTAFDIEGKLLATQHKNEEVATYLEVTSNASTNVEKFSITNRSHQQIPKDNASSEVPTGLCNKALSPLDESTQSGCMTYSADITSNGEKPKREKLLIRKKKDEQQQRACEDNVWQEMQAEDDWVPSEIKFSGGVILDGIEVASDTIQLSDEDIMILREFQSQETDGLQSSSICLPTSGVAHGGIIIETELEFDGCTVLNGFNMLSSSIFYEVTTISCDVVKEWCKQYCDKHWHNENLNWNVSSMNELFNMLNRSSYHNPINPGLLKFLANKFNLTHLITSVKNYEVKFSNKKFEDLDFVKEIIVAGDNICREESISIVSTLSEEQVTVGDMWSFCTPRLTKHAITVCDDLINADTLILDPTEPLLNFYYSVKDKETFLAKAKRENQVIDFQHIKILLTGSAAVGKTSFCRLLFQSKYSSEYKSTEVMEAKQAISVMNFSMLKHQKEIVWLKLNPKNQIMHIKTLLKSGKFQRESVPESLLEHVSTNQEITSILQGNIDDNNNDYNSMDNDNGTVDGGGSKSSRDGVVFSDVEKKILSSDSLPETVAIDSKGIRLITVIDSGGQPEYINMLPAINNCPTINFVVLDLTKNLDDPVMVQYKSKHDKNFRDYALHYSNLDMIGLLMSLTTDSIEQPFNEQIPTTASASVPNKCYVGFVGTHKDQLEKHKCEEIIAKTNSRLTSLTEGRISVLPAENGGILFAVDNTSAGESDSEDPVVKRLRQEIGNKINRSKSNNQLKITWMILELELQQLNEDSGKKFVTYEEYKKIAVEKASMDPKEVEESLQHFDFLGVFLRYKEVPGLCDYVIINHQWLFDSLAMIMHLSPEDINFQEIESKKQFKEKGLLAKDELFSVKWDGELNLKYFFNLLLYLKVIATVTLDDVQFYYIPCIFPSTKHYSDKYKFLYSEPLLVQFSSGFLPRGFFCSLVVQLLENLPTGWDHQLNNTEHFSNVITFELPDKSFLRLHDKTSYLEVQVRHYKGDLEVFHHQKIFHELSPYFTKVCKRLHLNHNKLQYGFLCHDSKSNDDHIAILESFQSPLPPELKRCCKNCQNRTKIGKLHKIWFEKIDRGASNDAHLITTDVEHAGHNTSTQILEQKPKMREINTIVVPRIKAEWEDVAYALCYEIHIVDAIKETNNRDPKKCCRDLLKDWLSTKHGVSPKTWSILIERLHEIVELAAVTKEIAHAIKLLDSQQTLSQ